MRQQTMRQQTTRFVFLSALAIGSPLGSGIGSLRPAIAQITPDQSLGAERSILAPGVPSDRGRIDRIDGGAQRGSNLFHSFSDFNVNLNQRVYFANPASISTIISRVTGGTLSNINGTLGVLGAANLFLINPNGIVFGPNAQLDMRGSLVASTADRIVFPDGYAFGTANPDAPPLLTVNAPLGLAHWLPTRGNITSSGNLTAGQDLTLAGSTLNLQGELRGGGDVSLLATNSLTARDTLTTPFIAAAGRQLWLQGNQSVDIVALSHPQSGLFAGGDMVLRSANPIGGDAHYTTGGNFRIEQLTGQPGSLFSPQDPIIRASGDVSFNSYTGASLHILAGGSVTIPGTITITGPEVTDFLAETVTLSNGSTVAVNGGTQPTIDIRAGTTAFGTVGITGATDGFTPIPTTGGPGTSANITLGTLVNPSGLVLLTNRYQPNAAPSGEIAVGSINTTADPASGLGGGTVAIDARGGLTFNAINASGGTFQTFPGQNLPDFSTLNLGGDGGDVTLLARGEIAMPFPTTIYTYGLKGGNITLTSDTAIVQANAPFGTDPFALSWIETDTFAADRGGDVRLTAPVLAIGGNIFSTMEVAGQGGDIVLRGNRLTTNQSTIATQTYGPGNAGNTAVLVTDALNHGAYSQIGSFNYSGTGGRGGDVRVEAGTLTAVGGAQIGSFAFQNTVGDAGNITVVAQDIALSGFLDAALAGGQFFPTAIFSSAQPGSIGNSGNVSITTATLSIQNAASVATTAFGEGNAGNVTINASQSISVDGAVFLDFVNRAEPSAINSELQAGATGQGGNIAITTPILTVTNGGTITAVTDGNGPAGGITINATQSTTVDGGVSFADVGQRDRPSQIAAFTAENATGDGGTLTLATPSLTLTNGGQLTAETLGIGNAGNLRANVSNALVVDGEGSGILANTSAGSTGNGGSIFVSNPNTATIRNGAKIAVNSQGSGTAGDIFLQAKNLVLRNQGLITAETTSNTGGNITLQVADVAVLTRNSRISTSAGTAGNGGDGGNITLNTRFLVAQPRGNSDITANAFTGRGGSVNITAEGIFGFTVLSRAQLEAALGTSDPNLLDPARLPTSDITAISRANPNLNGQVIIQSPNADPVRGDLPVDPQVVDASRLIAQDCSAGGAIGQARGSFVVTGRGGVPSSPTDALSGQRPLVGWETGESPSQSITGSVPPPMAPAPIQLVEVQALAKRPDGGVVLVASGASPQFWQPSVNCRATPAVP